MHRMNDNDELLDLVNEQNQVIGTIWRSQTPELAHTKAGFIRASNLFLQNDHGELWIPKRTAHKTIAPNGLDFSVGGHVESGSTYLETVLKETEEEINLTLSQQDVKLILEQKPHGYYICQFFLHRTNITPHFNPDDFVSARWMNVNQLVRELESGVAAKESLLETVQEIFTLDGSLRV